MPLLLLLAMFSVNASAHTLDGTWTTDCTPFGRHAVISTVDFDNGKLEALGNLYERPGCGVQTVKAEYEGTFETGKPYGEGIELNFVPEKFTLTPLKPDVVDHYNKNKICNFSDWQLNTPKDILSQPKCVGFTPPDKGVETYDIFSLKSDTDLRFSSFPLGKNVTNPSDRPQKIESQSIRLWKVSETNFNRVTRDLEIYDDHIQKRRNVFSKIPVDINDKSWIKQKLEFMFEIDQYMRNYLNVPYNFHYSKKEIEFSRKEFGTRFESMDRTNTADVKLLLKKYEWFTISEFGKQADNDAWLLVQHADLDHDFQNDVLTILGNLWRIGETNPRNYAYLFDRVAASFNDPSKRILQRYGTQGMCVGPGKWEPIEMEDPANVDKRRMEVGLEPLQNYINRFKDICK